MTTRDTSIVGKYVPSIHDLVAKPPYKFENLTTLSLMLDADNDALKKMTDTYLNKPLNGTTRFRPSGTGKMLLVISHFPVSYGRGHPGTIDYKEVALMFAVVEEGLATPKLSLFSPILILDGARQSGDWLASFPIALGREFYGLPKVRGEISYNTRHNLPEEDVGIYSACVKLSAKVDAKVPIPLQEFLNVEPEERPSLGKEIQLHDRELAARIRKIYGIGENAPKDALKLDQPLIGLSQLAHPANIGETIAQAVIRTPLEMHDPPRELASDLTVTFNTRDHGELIDTLGLDEKQTVRRWRGLVWRDAKGEFGNPAGTTVWQAQSRSG